MKVLLFKIGFLVCLLLQVSYANSFFLDTKAETLPGIQPDSYAAFGVSLGGVYYLSSFDASFALETEYHFLKYNAVHLFGALSFPEMTYELGTKYSFYFNPEKENFKDFCTFSLSVLFFEKFDDFTAAPRIGLAYGKDYKPFLKGPLTVRFTIGASYLIGDMLVRETSDYSGQSAHVVLFFTPTILF